MAKCNPDLETPVVRYDGGPIDNGEEDAPPAWAPDLWGLERPVEVRLSVLEAHLTALVKGRTQLGRLPLVLAIFLTWMLYCSAHMGVGDVHKVEVSMENAFLMTRGPPPHNHRFKELHTVEEFWYWMHDVFVPITFVENTGSNHTTGRVAVCKCTH